jgi:hypothetical protein
MAGGRASRTKTLVWAKRKPGWPEDRVQAAIVRTLRAALPPSAIVMAIGNGRASAAARMRQAALGAVPGAADLLVLWPGGLGFMEVKAAGKYPTPVQRSFAAKITALNVSWACVRSPDDALRTLSEWGAPLRDNTARAA